MENLQQIFDIAKNIVLIMTPIVTAIISYFSNKKSHKDIMNELNAKLLEKDKETSNEIQKMAAILYNYEQQICWNNAMEVTSEYLKKIIGIKRCTNVLYLAQLTTVINQYLTGGNYNLKSLKNLKQMLNKMQIPLDKNELYPIEIINLFNYNQLVGTLDEKIKELEENTDR